VLAGAPRDGRITRREKDEVIEIRTGQAESAAIARQEDQRSGTEIVAALVAAGLSVRNEDTQVTATMLVHRALCTTSAHETHRWAERPSSLPVRSCRCIRRMY
jgi:hypothetical protein